MSTTPAFAATEIDLETALPAAIHKVFPGPTISHQLEFALQLGQKTITKQGRESWTARGRADALVSFNGEPLAIFEFKRPDLELQEKDGDQGLSYARLLKPKMAPLVVITNGAETRILDTFTGLPIAETDLTHAAFQSRISNAAQVAAGDLRRAIDTLMGQDPDVWTAAVAAASADALSELAATAERPTRPLGRLRIPRTATSDVQSALSDGRFVVVSAPPLSGKTNVIADFVQSEDLAVGAALYIEHGRGAIGRRVADILARTLDWPITPEEARDWLRRVSQTDGGPRLVLAIDNVDPDDEATVRELEDFTSAAFGEKLKVVAALDAGAESRLLVEPRSRGETPLGRRATMVRFGALSNAEFRRATTELRRHDLGIMEGGQFSADLRQPWLLQALASRLFGIATGGVGVFPSVPGLEVISEARNRFNDAELRRRYRDLATALVADAQDSTRPPLMILQIRSRFFVRRDTLHAHVREADIKWLLERGYLVPAIGEHETPIVTIGVPELLASEMSRILADELEGLVAADVEHAAAWLNGAASNVLFGDVIAAQAILDLTSRSRLPFNLVAALAMIQPERVKLGRGRQLVAWIEGYGRLDLEEDGGEDDEAYQNVHAWLTLSHLAMWRMEVERDGLVSRVDRQLLLTLGQAEILLRNSSNELALDLIPVHETPDGGQLACYRAGIVEAITLHMMTYLRREARADADSFVEEALGEDDLYLTARLDLALRMLARSGDEDLAAWASETLAAKVRPFLTGTVADH